MTDTAHPTTDHATIGAALNMSPAVRAAIDTIVAETTAASEQITDIRPPKPELAEHYESLKARASATRGRPLLYPYIGSGVGNGALVELADGSVKWDLISGIGVHFFGHSHPEIIRAQLEAGLGDVTKSGNLQSNMAAYQFAETLLTEAGKNSRLKHAFVTTSGAMANESAIKVCYQKHAPASRAIAFEHCFMGRSVTMCQIGDSAAGRDGVPLTTQVDYMPFWNDALAEHAGGETKFIDACVKRLREYIERYPKQHACFIFELLQGEGGFNTAPRAFFAALMDVCKDANIAVWDDEIQSFGRLDRMFAYEALDLGDYVDVFCVGKMTQACATLFTEEYNPRSGLLSGTFTGAEADFTVGTRIIEMLRDGDYYGDDGRIARHHAAFREQANALIARHPEWFPAAPNTKELIGGRGGMMRITPFGGDKTKVINTCKAAFDEGAVLFWCGHGPFHVRMLPPLGTFKLEDWPRVFEVLERSLAKAAS